MDATIVPEHTNGLIDLTGTPLRQLLTLADDTVLAHSLRRVTAAADEKQSPVSKFNSAI